MNTRHNELLEPVQLGSLVLGNRIIMAPLTRARCGTAGIPGQLNALYYAQRASAGLIITEATNVSPMSAAFENAPGIYTPGQVDGWRRVAESVHAHGGKIFMQLWHGGRVSSYALLGGEAPLSPSAVNDDLGSLQVYGALQNGYYTRLAASPSRAMESDEIYAAIKQFRTGAANALKAGLDGVEIHAANGYLVQQFLSPHVNRRHDEFGGSIENRARFLRLVIEGILEVCPPGRVGVRISPYALYNNATDPYASDTYAYVIQMLHEYGIAYIHAADTNAWGGVSDRERLLALVNAHFRGLIIANAGITPSIGARLIAEGAAGAVAFGRPFVANPDLVARIAAGGPFNVPDPFTFYGGTEVGFTDYPAL